MLNIVKGNVTVAPRSLNKEGHDCSFQADVGRVGRRWAGRLDIFGGVCKGEIGSPCDTNGGHERL